MRVAVVGSREFNDYNLLKETLDGLGVEISCIVSGGAQGADTLAERYADENGIKKQIYYADWKAYGRAAGMIRNKLIVEDAEMLVAFWDGASRGTRNSIGLARAAGKKAVVRKFVSQTETGV